MENKEFLPDIGLDRQNRELRQRHQQALLDEVTHDTARWVDRIRLGRHLVGASLVLLFIVVTTPHLVARLLPPTPVRTSSMASQMHVFQLACEIVTLV